MVADAGADVGEPGSSGRAVIDLVHLRDFYIEVNVDENDIGPVGVGQPAGVDLEAFPDWGLTGRVAGIDHVGMLTQEIVSHRDNADGGSPQAGHDHQRGHRCEEKGIHVFDHYGIGWWINREA